MTLASLKEAQALVALEVRSDAMVSAAGTGWRATDSSPGDKLRAWGGSGLIPCGRVGGTVVDNGHFVGFHGSRGRSGRSGWPRGPSPDQPSCPWEATPEGVSTAPICGLGFHPRSPRPPTQAFFLLHPTAFLRRPPSQKARLLPWRLSPPSLMCSFNQTLFSAAGLCFPVHKSHAHTCAFTCPPRDSTPTSPNAPF